MKKATPKGCRSSLFEFPQPDARVALQQCPILPTVSKSFPNIWTIIPFTLIGEHSLFGVQFFFNLFLQITGVLELAPFICCITLSFLINKSEKKYIKSLNIAFSILVTYFVIMFVIGTFIAVVFPNFYSLYGVEYNAVMAICIFASAFLIKKFDKFFINEINEKKILKFHLLLKFLTFIFMGIGLSILSEREPEIAYPIIYAVVFILVTIFFINKFHSKLISKLENEKNIALMRNVEAEIINKKYDDMIKLKHYYVNLHKSAIGFIEAGDMVGLKEYYRKNIASINDELSKELINHKQIELMEISLIKARLIELVNTVSQIPNVKLTININDVINDVAMKDKDLFAILNIFIDNAVDEIREQEKGKIRIEITKTHESVEFVIFNSLIGYNSSPKPESNNRGRIIADEIIIAYSNVEIRTDVKSGSYV